MKVHNKTLVLFTRFPEAGKAKTRLIPVLGDKGAAELQRKMTEYVVKQARKTGAHIEIRYAGGSLMQMQEWLGDDVDYAEQGDGDLGECMQRAFEDHFALGCERIVLIGSDCPTNDWNNIQSAFKALDTHECVIGPANDGGYYLIGLDWAGSGTQLPRSWTSATFPAKLFQDIDWGGEQVFQQTMEAASNLSVGLLPELNDIDVPKDIPPKISVIIPTLNEEKCLAHTLEKINEGFHIETIVVDGGSTDGTRNIFSNTLECKKGRAAQQNFGAENASGEIILFLHADTILPDRWDWIIRETLENESVALGAFTFEVRESFPGKKFIEDTANWRSRFGNLPFGDQGLFIRKETYNKAGGFPDLPIMEDYTFARALRKFGRIVTVPQVAITSGRRWQQHGVVKVTLINKLMILGYHLGVPPEKLARLYRRG